MRKHRALLAFSLVLASTCTLAAAAFGEEMVVDSAKTYTPGANNGQPGYWVTFTRQHFTKNQMFIASPVGRYDATIQEVLAKNGLNRALSPAELTNIYNQYGIPFASGASYDSAAYHNFDWNGTLARIQADAAAGRLRVASLPSSYVESLAAELNANNSAALVAKLGPAAVDALIENAFSANNGAQVGEGAGYGNAGVYTYWGDNGKGGYLSPGWHTLGTGLRSATPPNSTRASTIGTPTAASATSYSTHPATSPRCRVARTSTRSSRRPGSRRSPAGSTRASTRSGSRSTPGSTRRTVPSTSSRASPRRRACATCRASWWPTSGRRTRRSRWTSTTTARSG